MTLTLELTPEQEATLKRRASLAGLDVSTYAVQILADTAPTESDEDSKSLFDRLNELGVIGAVKGTSGPGDGRSWSEIEAACDPL